MSAPATAPQQPPPQPTSPPPSASISAPPPAPPPAAPSVAPPPVATSVPPAAAPPPATISSPPPPQVLNTPPATPGSAQLPPPVTGKPPPSPPPSPGLVNSHPALPLPPPFLQSPPNGSGSQGNGGASTTVIVGGVVGGAIVLLVVVLLVICLRKKKSKGTRSYRKGYSFGEYARGDMLEAGRSTGMDVPYSSSEMSGKPYYPPPPPPLSPHRMRQSPEAHLLGSSYGSGSAIDISSKPPPKLQGGSQSLGISQSSFTYSQLEEATQGFSRANLLGEGGFGQVFKGVLPDARVVAVKQLKVGGGQGEREFYAEVETISRVHHRHLVSLVGYCISDRQRMLVYEFVPNGTLEFHLHGNGRPVIDWPTRVKIAVGAARGLAYLHTDCHPRIIHRDIKSSNILLDYQFEAQVSDFGLAKLASDTNTHVSTRVMGTFGYLAPEYALSGKLTDKSDVYSFGVVLLELLTGRKPVDSFGPLDDESLVEWARPLLIQALEQGSVEGLIDPRLERNYNQREVKRMIEVAAACVRHSAHKRPKMVQVARALEGDTEDLNQGLRPGHSSKYDLLDGSSDYDTTQYNLDLKRFRKMALGGSQEYGSEASYSPSEYGVNQSASSGEHYANSKEIERKPIFIDRDRIS